MDKQKIAELCWDYVREIRIPENAYIKGAENRLAFFDKYWMHIKKQELQLRPYLRVFLCAEMTTKAVHDYGNYSTQEVAHYISKALEDIEYVVNNNIEQYCGYQDIFSFNYSDADSVICAIVEHLSFETVIRYINFMIDNGNRGHRDTMRLHSSAVKALTLREKNYQDAIIYGEAILELYQELYNSLDNIEKRDTQKEINSIILYLDQAYQGCDIVDKQNQSAAAAIRADIANQQLAHNNRLEKQEERRSELLRLAQECLERGDQEGYQGYLWVLSDLGR